MQRTSMSVNMFTEVARYHGLLGMLAWRDIRVRYKQSLLGVAWAFLMPLIQTLVLYAIFTYGPLRVTSDMTRGMPYLMFVLAGVVPWTFLASSIAVSVECLTRNSRLVTKIYFPREVFPLGCVTACLVDFAIAWIIVLPFWLYFQFWANVPEMAVNLNLLWFFAALAVQTLFVAGISMVLSMANLFFRDVKYVMAFVIQVWFFATNVMYPIRFDNNKTLALISDFNVMIPVLQTYRDALAGHSVSNPLGLAVAALIALAVFFGGWALFHKAEFKFAEYV